MTRDRTRLIVGITGGLLLAAHGALSAYWALGGTALLPLLSETVRNRAETGAGWFIATIWAVAFLKLAVALAGLGLTVNWPVSRIIERAQVLLCWITGVGLSFYGGMNLVIGFMSLLGLIDGPADRDAAFWGYLLLWAPWWTAIGICYLLFSVIVSRQDIRAFRSQ